MRTFVRKGLGSKPRAQSAPKPQPTTRETLPPFWGEFLAAFGAHLTAAEEDRTSIKWFADCSRFSIWTRSPSAERRQVEPWCGHAYCPACASHAEQRARHTALGWDTAEVLVARIPLPPSDTSGLPTQEEVASARERWGRVPKRLGADLPLESMPRLVIEPDAVSMFLRAPATRPHDALERLQEACRQEGIPELTAAFVGRADAADRFAAAVGAESRTFIAAVEAQILEQRTYPWWDAAFGSQPLDDCAADWLRRARARHADQRRKTILGARGSLAAPSSRPDLAEPQTPTELETTVVRDHTQQGRVIAHVPGVAFESSPSRPAVAAFWADVRARHHDRSLRAAG